MHPNGQKVHEKISNITNHKGNANQNHNELSPYICQNGFHEEDSREQVLMRKLRELSYTVGENVNWCSNYRRKKNMKVPEYVQTIYCHASYLTYMKSTSREILGWMMYKLESRLQREISIISDMQVTPPLWHKLKRN